MYNIDKKTYRFVTVLTAETCVLGVPVTVWDNAFLGRFQQNMAVYKGLIDRKQADLSLAARGGEDPG